MNFDFLIGMTVFRAADKLEKISGHSIKQVTAVIIDGEPTLITAEYHPSRLQVETTDGIITSIRGVG